MKLKSKVFLLGPILLGGLADSHHYYFCLEAEEVFLCPWDVGPATESYQRDVCLSTMEEQACKKASMATVKHWPLSAAWLWKLRHHGICSSENDEWLDPSPKSPALGTRDGWAIFWQGSQHPGCLGNESLVASCVRLCVCMQRSAFSIPTKEEWRELCKEYAPEFCLCFS